MNQINLIFVHSGRSPIPKCMIDSVLIASRIALGAKIYCLIDDLYKENFHKAVSARIKGTTAQIILVSVEHLPRIHSQHFDKQSKSNREFRAGFWFATSNRFMLIADLMRALSLENCLHVENDVVLYFNPQEKINEFRKHARFAVPFDRHRAIPGLVWYRDPQIASVFAEYMATRSEEPDFDVLRAFCNENQTEAKPLPTMPREYAVARGLDEYSYCFGCEEFNGIFDAAAIGQYLGGVDWKNNQQNTRFFENESSDLKVSELDITWAKNSQHRYPLISVDGAHVKILSLHAHSKDCEGVSPYNTGAPEATDDIITGERLQALASLTVSSESITAFHGKENIATPFVVEVPAAQFRPNEVESPVEREPQIDMVEVCQEAQTIFVYTHLIGYFKKYIAPRLNAPFTLITHNSDHAITINDLELLNHSHLTAWYGQNIEFNHKKLKALPIGLPNRQWGARKLEALKAASEQYVKTKAIYLNFDPSTHPSRGSILPVLQNNSNITIRAHTLEYTQYLAELAEHKFCVCPRGNGIDTHRFWECQYVDTIPIIIRADWTEAYSSLPVIVLDNWDQLNNINLKNSYLISSTTSFDRSTLRLSMYKAEINFSK